ncbi:nitric oxide-sensing protein NosP [Legionella bononiensis]|uniref:FIST C-terminal domain-containing protein n=1 Tax=Legionella bononiensis TaxID=2793102 RepID=A0ABS1W971_9GAMM|nr:nitric oxide-sensing protein NosP [Legionella bononiensis]MBL7479594.1 FIST C-terminal domain-containing protein [Legionella bononiensis]MBL7525894.1 FIST C-terminal domain-containing protein [Legionella bononiensis]MBL7562300.1 FIST C-terminal domain-containing protein [Legionella bononiensis]
MSVLRPIQTGQSFAKDPLIAAKEFHAAVYQPNMELIVFFCSSHYDLDALANALNSLFPNEQIIGCTTAGEIGPGGYSEYTLSGVSFSSNGFKVATGYINDLQNLNNEKSQEFVNTLLQQLEVKAPDTTPRNSFAFLMIDGMSLQEEPTARMFQNALGEVTLFGGSAGDDLNFKQTWVFSDHAFHADSAVLTLINTTYPFKIFKAQHFVGCKEKLVVTQADPLQRIVYEINGYPAAEEYARHVGTQVTELDPMQFSATPVVIRINGVDYVRSIQKVNPDGSLTFYCAIDNGLVFMAAHGVDLVNNVKQTFKEIQSDIGKPQLILACDCVLRNLEMQSKGLKKEIEQLFKNNNVVGFSTYGEQFRGVHINQTLTGLAIGESRNNKND